MEIDRCIPVGNVHFEEGLIFVTDKGERDLPDHSQVIF